MTIFFLKRSLLHSSLMAFVSIASFTMVASLVDGVAAHAETVASPSELQTYPQESLFQEKANQSNVKQTVTSSAIAAYQDIVNPVNEPRTFDVAYLEERVAVTPERDFDSGNDEIAQVSSTTEIESTEPFLEDYSTASTSAAELLQPGVEEPFIPNEEVVQLQVEEASTTEIAQLDELDIEDVDPGRPTRSGPSYIGVGGNIGLAGDPIPLGEGAFAAFAKIGLIPRASVRPTIILGDDATILLPVTVDFSFQDFEALDISVGPYLGAGLGITTGEDDAVDLLLSGGVDVPFSDRFTGTIGINVAIFDDPAIGVILGVGYNIGRSLFD